LWSEHSQKLTSLIRRWIGSLGLCRVSSWLCRISTLRLLWITALRLLWITALRLLWIATLRLLWIAALRLVTIRWRICALSSEISLRLCTGGRKK
jgi:hypothetical protein